MIGVTRGPEPPKLAVVRSRELLALRKLGRPPRSDDIDGYREVAEDLWRTQYYKCCYCERKLEEGYNDVEHYRPKARADRSPGSAETHGYWWLAFTWDNLLFACPSCNRSGKNDQFPLGVGASALRAEDLPPGRERPLLLDPAGSCPPAEHIQFVMASLRPGDRFPHWWARPRQGSVMGSWTIAVCDLNRDALRELRGDYVDLSVKPRASALLEALRSKDPLRIKAMLTSVRELLLERAPFTLLSYDALRTFVPATAMRARGLRWPEPWEIPVKIRT